MTRALIEDRVEIACRCCWLLVFALSRVKQLRVTEADDGVDGLRKLATTKFDIIITDINMPIMDGLKLVKRVRGDPTHKDVPIIIINVTSPKPIASRLRAAVPMSRTAQTIPPLPTNPTSAVNSPAQAA